MKEHETGKVVQLLNRRNSVKNDILCIQRAEWEDCSTIIFQSIPFQLDQHEFADIKDLCWQKLYKAIQEIDNELAEFGITMEDE